MKRLRLATVILVGICCLALTATAQAEVKLPAIFGDSMVLQREMPVPVWGWAKPGEKVTVSFAGQTVSATADAKGKWTVRLEPLKVSAEPSEMTVKGTNTVTLKDILVGEVWICCGQSNMQHSLRAVTNAEQEVAAADYPNIRLFRMQDTWTPDGPQPDCKGQWQACTPKSARGFSGVGYFFGRDLHKELKVPIGLVDNAVNGSVPESWMTPAALNADKDLKRILTHWDKLIADYPEAKKQYDRKLAEWEKAAADAKAAGKPAPRRRFRQPMDPASHKRPNTLYNGMIAPIVPLAVKGIAWYQGEHSAHWAYLYRKLFPGMMACWRKLWGRDDLPFMFVQLPNYAPRQKDPNERSGWAELREAQLMALSVPNTAMAVTIDVGEARSIHPANKKPVGQRLALAALATVYGRKIVYSGPIFEKMSVEGDKVRVNFTHTGGGLVAKGAGPVKGFVIAGEDKTFHWAEAKIDGDTVLVWSKDVPKPLAVRYAYAHNPECNLCNKEGLPASPFRTDQWTHWTKGKP